MRQPGDNRSQRVEPHLAVVLRDRDAGVDRRFPGGDRHVRRVHDEDGPRKHRGAGARIRKRREFREDLRHLVAAFPAAHEYDDVRFGVLGQRLLAERRAEKYIADVVSAGANPNYQQFYRAKALSPIKPTLLLSENTDPSKWFEGKHQGFIADELFDLCQQVRAAMVVHRSKPSEMRTYLLHDRLYCARCIANKPTGLVDDNYGRMRPYYHNQREAAFYRCLAHDRG